MRHLDVLEFFTQPFTQAGLKEGKLNLVDELYLATSTDMLHRTHTYK
jgi:hypothetical protein